MPSLPRLPLPFQVPEEASFYGRYTFNRHRRAALLDAVASGVLLLNEYVATKALGVSDLGITLLLMLPTVAQLVNLYWTGVSDRDPRSAFLWVGVPARLAVVALAWTSSAFWFVVLASLASIASTIVIPAQNAIYQANYARHERGRLFSRVSASAAVVTVAVVTALGWVYDRDERLYRVAYPVAGIAAALGALAWYRIQWRRRDFDSRVSAAGPVAVAAVPRPSPPTPFVRLGRGIVGPFRSAVRLFDEDRDFLRFECAFMTYGIAYMMIQPVIPLFLVRELGVDYSEASQAKGLLFYLLMVLFLPSAGRLNDRVGSLKVATASFLVLGVFPTLLFLAHDMTLVYLAYAAFGIAMAGVNVTWTLGPLAMAGERNAERYMGAHVSLVGVRGLIGFPLGLALMRAVSPRAVFAVSALVALAAAAIMGSLARKRASASVGGSEPRARRVVPAGDRRSHPELHSGRRRACKTSCSSVRSPSSTSRPRGARRRATASSRSRWCA